MDSYYKYKSITEDANGEIDKISLEYVIQPISESYYYLPTRKQLNDPSEGTYVSQIQEELSGYLKGVSAIGERNGLSSSIYSLLNQIDKSTDNSGVFSLSKEPIDELMWAHYSNAHKGIVIEYDLDLLIRFSARNYLHKFYVKYSDKPPEFVIKNIQDKLIKYTQILLGNKSLTWKYESEFRILMENINGKIPHDYRAVKSITFGLLTSDKVKQQIFELTKHKVQSYLHARSATVGADCVKRSRHIYVSAPDS
jgi:hypothetical protein